MLKKDISEIIIIDKRLDKIISKLGDHPFMNSLGSRAEHASEGVRVNGRGRRVSYPDLKEEFDSIEEDYQNHIKLLPTIKGLIKEVKSVLDKYKLCPVCKGKQIFNLGYHMHDDPEECGECDGHGVILKDKK